MYGIYYQLVVEKITNRNNAWWNFFVQENFVSEKIRFKHSTGLSDLGRLDSLTSQLIFKQLQSNSSTDFSFSRFTYLFIAYCWHHADVKLLIC